MDTISNEDVAEQRRYLLRYAQLHLRDPARAEDVVQETLAAAVEQGGRFSGGSSLRTWLTGILKHKIVDLIRRQLREAELPRDAEGDEAIDRLFLRDGHWAEPLRPWGNPESEAELGELRRVLNQCADRLNPSMARVFSLREVAGMETGEICKELGITPTHCWVLLHRARVFMRQCLESNGFSRADRT